MLGCQGIGNREPRRSGFRAWGKPRLCLWVLGLLPVGDPGALGNSTGRKGRFGAGSCVTSQEILPGAVVGRRLVVGLEVQSCPPPALEVAAS